jgi:hypothetical protein
MEVRQKMESTGVHESMMHGKIDLHALTGDMQKAGHALVSTEQWE